MAKTSSSMENKILGLLFLGFGTAHAFGIGFEEANLTHGILFWILAKTFFIHSDIEST